MNREALHHPERIAVATIMLSGALALSGCTPHYDGAVGCYRATLSPDYDSLREALIHDIKHRGDSNQINNGSMHGLGGAANEAGAAITAIYAQKYGAANHVLLQSGDSFAYCLHSDGTIEFDQSQAVIASGDRYVYRHDDWQQAKR